MKTNISRAPLYMLKRTTQLTYQGCNVTIGNNRYKQILQLGCQISL